MVRWLWILSLLVCLGSARADTPSWEDIPPSPSAQPLVDTTGSLRPNTYAEVGQLAASVSESGQGRLVIVVIPRASDDLYSLASELYDSWHVASGKDDGAVLVLELEHLAAGVSPGWNLGTSQDSDALRESVQQALGGKKEPDAIVLAAAQVMAEWMKQAPTRTGRDRAQAQAPFADFLYPHAAVADPDRLLNPALTRKLRQWRRSDSSVTFVVYDRSQHPVEARAAAEHLHTTWGMRGWLVVLSARPAGAWLIPSHDFGEKGGYRAGLPKAVTAWTRAMARLDPATAQSSSAEAWDEALQQLTALTSYQEPPSQDARQATQSQTPWKANWAAFLLSVGLFVLARSWIWRLEEGAGPHSLGAFVVCGLLYTVVYGCALGWVFEQSLLLGVFASFVSFPVVFGGLRRLCEECNWDGPVGDVIAPSSLGIANTLRLVEQAELVTALRSAPGARLLSRSDDAGAAVFRAMGRGLLLPLFFMGAFVVLAYLGRGRDAAAAVEQPSRGSATRRRKKKRG